MFLGNESDLVLPIQTELKEEVERAKAQIKGMKEASLRDAPEPKLLRAVQMRRGFYVFASLGITLGSNNLDIERIKEIVNIYEISDAAISIEDSRRCLTEIYDVIEDKLNRWFSSSGSRIKRWGSSEFDLMAEDMVLALVLLRENEPNYQCDSPNHAGIQTMWRIVRAVLKTTYVEQLSFLDQSLVREQCYQNKVSNRIAFVAALIAAASFFVSIAPCIKSSSMFLLMLLANLQMPS